MTKKSIVNPYDLPSGLTLNKLNMISTPRQLGKSTVMSNIWGGMTEEEPTRTVNIGDLIRKLREEFQSVDAPESILDKFEIQCKSLLQMASNFSSYKNEQAKKKTDRKVLKVVYETGRSAGSMFSFYNEYSEYSGSPHSLGRASGKTYHATNGTFDYHSGYESTETDIAIRSYSTQQRFKVSGFNDKWGDIRRLSKRILKSV